ncbi:MAG: hypothetical protein ACUVRY_10375 [Thermoanaerobaculaceae bacterium]
MEEERVLTSICERCGQERPAWSVKECPICGRRACLRCGTVQYGRQFCSPRCAAFFFHGDPEEVEEES